MAGFYSDRAEYHIFSAAKIKDIGSETEPISFILHWASLKKGPLGTSDKSYYVENRPIYDIICSVGDSRTDRRAPRPSSPELATRMPSFSNVGREGWTRSYPDYAFS